MEQFTPFDRLFQSCGRIWHIRRADMDKLWAAMDQQEGEEAHLPYWNEIWPSSLALAGWLAEMQDDIKGRSCLDMGCGLGFTALLGQWLGAEVTAMDYEKEALEYAKINAVLNGIEGVNFTVMDWTTTFCILWCAAPRCLPACAAAAASLPKRKRLCVPHGKARPRVLPATTVFPAICSCFCRPSNP